MKIRKIIIPSFLVIAIDVVLYYKFIHDDKIVKPSKEGIKVKGNGKIHLIPKERKNYTHSSSTPTKAPTKKHTLAPTNEPTTKEMLSKHIKEIDPKRYKFYRQRYRSPIVIEQYKLIWFLNPKVASTNTKFLLARMSNQTVDPLTTKEENLNLKKLNDYPHWQVRYFLGSPDWKRVIVIRDPAERLLSAYLGKEHRYHDSPKRNSKSHFKIVCCGHRSAKSIKDCNNHYFTFNEFYELAKTCPDLHWETQYNLVEDWTFITNVINFNNLANDTKRLLHDISPDVWKKYGSSGWGINGTSAIFEENNLHRSDSQSRYDEFYTPKLKEEVEQRYNRDYDVIRKHTPDMLDTT